MLQHPRRPEQGEDHVTGDVVQGLAGDRSPAHRRRQSSSRSAGVANSRSSASAAASTSRSKPVASTS